MIKIISENKNEIEVEVDEVGLAEALVYKLNAMKDVELANYKQIHPSKNECIIYVKAKTPKKKIIKAAEELIKELEKIKA